MYFWNVKAAAEALKQGRLSQREKFRYFLLFMAATTLGSGSAGTGGGELTVLVALAVLAVTIWGVTICFQANEQGDGKEFIDRFIVLGLPLMVRLFVVAIPLAVVLTMIAALLGIGADTPLAGIFGIIFVVAVEALFYVWMRSWLRRVAQ